MYWQEPVRTCRAHGRMAEGVEPVSILTRWEGLVWVHKTSDLACRKDPCAQAVGAGRQTLASGELKAKSEQGL